MEEEDDHIVQGYDAADLQIAAEFLTDWISFLTRGLCADCPATIRRRIELLHQRAPPDTAGTLEFRPNSPPPPNPGDVAVPPPQDPAPPVSSYEQIEPTGWDSDPIPEPSPQVRLSWADMAVEDELEEEEAKRKSGAAGEERLDLGDDVDEVEAGEGGSKPKAAKKLSRDQREYIRFRNVERKKDFICLERVKGKIVNVLGGLELHSGVVSSAEQKRIVDFVYELQEKGSNGQLGEHTFYEPEKRMKGEGRVTIQFGCCYNSAMDGNGNPASIIPNIASEPIPQLFKVIIKRLVRWHVVPPSCTPDSCIVNIYGPGDSIFPHIDSRDFVRPISTVSFLSECNMLFGSNLKIEGPGKFSGSLAIPLPIGSVLVLNGNAADICNHCVPAVPAKRISITFRKIDESKRPVGYISEPDLQNLRPLSYDSPSDSTPDWPLKTDVSANNTKRSKRRAKKSFKKPQASTPESGFQDDCAPQRDLDHHRGISLPQLDDEWRPPSIDGAPQRATGLSRRSYGRKPRPDLRNEVLDEASNVAWRSPHSSADACHDEGEGSDFIGYGCESVGRRVRMEQSRIVVTRNLDGEGRSARWLASDTQRPRGHDHASEGPRRQRRSVQGIFPDRCLTDHPSNLFAFEFASRDMTSRCALKSS